MAIRNQREGVILYLGALVVVTGITQAGYQAPPPPQDMLAGSVVIVRDTKPCPVRGSSCQCGCTTGEPCRCAITSPASIVVDRPLPNLQPTMLTGSVLPTLASYTIAPVHLPSVQYQPVQVQPTYYQPAYQPTYYGGGFSGGACAGGG